MADSPADAEVTATLQTFGDKQIRNSHQLPDTSNAPTDEFREVPIVEQVVKSVTLSNFHYTGGYDRSLEYVWFRKDSVSDDFGAPG